MDENLIFELVHEAVAQALDAQQPGRDLKISRRLLGGRVLLEDAQGREVRAVAIDNLFKKVTAVRERLRVLEQKLNNHKSLDLAERAELQDYITKCYGSLTTFNFMFQDDEDRFRGSGG